MGSYWATNPNPRGPNPNPRAPHPNPRAPHPSPSLAPTLTKGMMWEDEPAYYAEPDFLHFDLDVTPNP